MQKEGIFYHYLFESVHKITTISLVGNTLIPGVNHFFLFKIISFMYFGDRHSVIIAIRN